LTTIVEKMEVGALLAVGGGSPQTLALLATRRSSSAPTLLAPGPDAVQLAALLELAARVPDHGKLFPWRFIVLKGDAKSRFVDALEAIATNQEGATKMLAALVKIRNPPLTVAVVSRAAEGRIPVWEQQLSAGAVCMNLLLAAHAQGFGANWITDWYAYAAEATALLGLQAGERIAGYVHIGTQGEVPKERPRADMTTLISYWQAP
jgi:nitroreductase